jgi:cation-transporting ATPase E
VAQDTERDDVKTQVKGLTNHQVDERIARGEINTPPQSLTRPIPRIIRDHVFTLFNILNLILFLFVVFVGEYKNGLFFLVAVSNTVIGSFQDIRAKLTIDKLAVITQTHADVIRDGQKREIPQEEVVLGDAVLLSLGNQVCADSVVEEAENLEVDESLLTGEAHPIIKSPGDKVYSGSFVVAGSGVTEVVAVGKDSYAQSISAVTQYEKTSNSQLMRIINFIIRTLAFVLVPLSAALFVRTYFLSGNDFAEAILAMVAAAVGMVPEGLMLLTGLAFAVGAFNLTRKKTLTQSMPSIETLARVDVLCLDKTGTITDGTLAVEEIVPLSGDWQGTKQAQVEQLEQTELAQTEQIEQALAQFTASMGDDNETAHALHARYSDTPAAWTKTGAVPFSSARKWSGQSFADKGSFVLGAPEFVMPDASDPIKEVVSQYAEQGMRVLLFAHSSTLFSGTDLPPDLDALALVVFSDHVRTTAHDTFAFFADNDVEIKVISGDDPQTVSTIAAAAGIKGAENYIDMSKVPDGTSLADIVIAHTVFGRVSPLQKQDMVKVLKQAGKIVGMVGDGVNDTMALREADVGVAMASGSDAARTVADFVLVDSDFASMVSVDKEGRRVVNNIEKVASLYIVKTIYMVLLTVIFIALPFEYPFQPIQLTLINFFMIGVPSFFLTFTPNYAPMNDNFGYQLMKEAVPAAILVVLNVVVVQLLGRLFSLSFEQTSTLSVLMNGIVSALLLIRLSQPYTKPRLAMNIILITGYFAAFIFMNNFFELVHVLNWLILIWIPLTAVSVYLYEPLSRAALAFMCWYQKTVLWIKNRGRTYTALKQG